jgi:hypothetical protein
MASTPKPVRKIKKMLKANQRANFKHLKKTSGYSQESLNEIKKEHKKSMKNEHYHGLSATRKGKMRRLMKEEPLKKYL